MMISIFFIVLMMLLPSSHAGVKECRTFLQNVFGGATPQRIQAPRKPGFEIDPSSIIAQEGIVKRVYRDPKTDELITEKFPAFRIFPDSKSKLGKYAASLGRMKTNLYIIRSGGPEMKSLGYFSTHVEFKVSDLELAEFGDHQLGKAVVLRGGQVNPVEFQSTVMHEGSHAHSQSIRDRGGATRFDSEIRAADGVDLKKAAYGYEDYLHSEEVQTHVKDFTFTSVIAHNGDLMRMIDRQAKGIPDYLGKKKRFDRITISFDSVIDRSEFGIQYRDTLAIVESHRANVRTLENQINKSLKNPGSGGVKFTDGRKGKLLVQTPGMEMTFHDVAAIKGVRDPAYAMKKLRQMKVMDQLILERMARIKRLKDAAEAKGYFSANDYMEFKDELSKLNKIVRKNR
jgi:hypothetical protein